MLQAGQRVARRMRRAGTPLAAARRPASSSSPPAPHSLRRHTSSGSGSNGGNGGVGKSSHDYQHTLLLPRAEGFPMRANATTRDPAIQAGLFSGLYREQAERRAGSPLFVLHDGPPYANGLPHLGHLVNKVLKDMTLRFQLLQGRRVYHRPGFDCHGLPIELKASKTLRSSERGDPATVRRRAREVAEEAVAQQAAEFRSWGVLGDWDRPYLTMDPSFEARELDLFHRMFKLGLIYRDLKPVYWSPSTRTALAEAELEYAEHCSQAVFVCLPLCADSPGGAASPSPLFPPGHRVELVVWTTTPWTLPGNQAVCVNPLLTYGLCRRAGDDGPDSTVLVVAKESMATLPAELEPLGSPHDAIPGSQLLGLSYHHPFSGDRCPVIGAAHVTADAGTGLVHTAPAHGMEDYLACKKEGLGINQCLVDARGAFTSGAPAGLEGLKVLDSATNAEVVQRLAGGASLLAPMEDLRHRYPHDWRSKKPVLLRATEQWFADVGGLREKALSALDDVKIVPETGRSRLMSMLGGRQEWCISRQRVWGLPIPVFYDSETGAVVIDDALFARVRSLVAEHGSDCWWNMSTAELLGPAHAHLADRVVKGTDTLDVWFDSGSSWTTLADAGIQPEVADLYLEGSDQHRGWFQSSLLTTVAQNDGAESPFRTLITHGFVVDDSGRKMSKSLGNGVDPATIIAGGNNRKAQPAFGADVARWWVASTDYTKDIQFSQTTLVAASDQLRKIRNTVRFLLGTTHDFDRSRDSVPFDQLWLTDRCYLSQLASQAATISRLYTEYDFSAAQATLVRFVNTQVSAIYFEAVKDRVYAEDEASPSRRAAQQALLLTIDFLSHAIAPVACHLAEEIHWFRRRRDGSSVGDDSADEAAASVVFESWMSSIDPAWAQDTDRDAAWALVLEVRRAVFRSVQEARTEHGIIKGSQDARIEVTVEDAHVLASLGRFQPPGPPSSSSELAHLMLCSEMHVSSAEPGAAARGDEHRLASGERVWVSVAKTEQHKCPRCWRFTAASPGALSPRCDAVLSADGRTQQH